MARWEILDAAGLDAIHEATLQVLETTGVGVYEPKALEHFRNAGCEVDEKKRLARLPRGLVEEMRRKAPHHISLHARDPKWTVRTEEPKTFTMNSGLGVHVLELESGGYRSSVLSDTASYARLGDALAPLDTLCPAVAATDQPEQIRSLRELQACVTNSAKHISHEAMNTRQARHLLRISALLAGGEEEARKRPVISAGGSPVSPLQLDTRNTEVLLELVAEGMPYIPYSMVMAGATAPLTLPGALTVLNAEQLAVVTLAQLVNPGTPVFYCSVSSVTDMRTGILALGAPERGLISGAAAEFARYYSLPSFVGACSTDAKAPGAQAVFEKMLTVMGVLVCRPNILFGSAGVESAATFSLEQFAIDAEIFEAARRYFDGIRVDADGLATELIMKIGPGGQFLAERHTLRHIPTDQWRPRLLDRNSRLQWEKLGKPDLVQAATAQVKKLLAEHRPLPLEPEVAEGIEQVIQEAAKDPRP